MEKWTIDNIGDQTGKIVIVTGANSGIGFETAKVLTLKGAHVILACRNKEKGEKALHKIEEEKPLGKVELMILDLSDFDSIKSFAKTFLSKYRKIDILINNAGVMIPPFSKTSEGFELQIGTNFLGHFLLTSLLIDAILATPGSRIVTLSSIAHRNGKIDFENFRGEKKYVSWREYNQSKLADLIFAFELNHRIQKTGNDTISLAVHPGVTVSDLQRHNGFVRFVTPLIGMKASGGALPSLRAATDPDVKGGEYYGPGGFYEMKGYPANKCKINPLALDVALREQLWKKAEELTKTKFLSE